MVAKWLSLMRIEHARDVQTMYFVLRLAETIDSFVLNRTLGQATTRFDESAEL